MKKLYSEVVIEASAKTVWAILTDFSLYPSWNPFVRKISGNVKVGEKLTIYIKPSNGSGMEFKPNVLRVAENTELSWKGKLLIPNLFDGEHIFIIEPISPNKVRFIQQEIFTGILVPLFEKKLDKETLVGFEEMNAALKQKAEEMEKSA